MTSRHIHAHEPSKRQSGSSMQATRNSRPNCTCILQKAFICTKGTQREYLRAHYHVYTRNKPSQELQVGQPLAEVRVHGHRRNAPAEHQCVTFSRAKSDHGTLFDIISLEQILFIKRIWLIAAAATAFATHGPLAAFCERPVTRGSTLSNELRRNVR